MSELKPLSLENQLRDVLIKSSHDAEFRGKLIGNPKAALKKLLKVELPEKLQLVFVEKKSDAQVYVLPRLSAGKPAKLESAKASLACTKPASPAAVKKAAVPPKPVVAVKKPAASGKKAPPKK
jgi:hypothetical protein